MSDLEPLDLPPAADGATAAPDEPRRAPQLRERFLVALTVVVAAALIALAVQIRAIASEQEDETRCSRALVAFVSADFRGQDQGAVRARVAECLGEEDG